MMLIRIGIGNYHQNGKKQQSEQGLICDFEFQNFYEEYECNIYNEIVFFFNL